MNLPIEIQILKLVTTKLEELTIPYMLSGSVASSFYAELGVRHLWREIVDE